MLTETKPRSLSSTIHKNKYVWIVMITITSLLFHMFMSWEAWQIVVVESLIIATIYIIRYKIRGIHLDEILISTYNINA